MNFAKDVAYVAKAVELYAREGAVEFDDEPSVSEGSDDGAYVQAWVWVSVDDLDAEEA